MNKKRIAFLATSITLVGLLLSAVVFGQSAEKPSLYRFLSVFTEVFSLVRNAYVEEVAPDQLVDGAFTGVTEAVDEYSYYVPPARMQAHRAHLAQPADQTGITVSSRFGYAYVVAVAAGSPADEAGVDSGDLIEKIGGRSTQGMSLWEMRSALATQTQKPLAMTVVKAGMAKRAEVTLPARQLNVKPTWRAVGSVAYVKIPAFTSGSALQLRAVLASVRQAGLKKMIVDVRENAVGTIDEAVLAADAFLEKGTITATQGRHVEPRTWTADAENEYADPLEVLVDHSTAGPAEVFAAALGGNERAKLVGTTTYGHSVIQKFVSLRSGGGLQVTIGHYTHPDAKPIKETGIRPDVVVEMTALPGVEGEPETDEILERALELFGEPEAEAKAKAAA